MMFVHFLYLEWNQHRDEKSVILSYFQKLDPTEIQDLDYL